MSHIWTWAGPRSRSVLYSVLLLLLLFIISINKMENLDLDIDKVLRQLNEWNEASSNDKIALYKHAGERLKRLFLLSMSYFSLAPYGFSSALIELFNALHDSPCKVHGDSMECVDSPRQKEAFQKINKYRIIILANDPNLIYKASWAQLIASLDNNNTQAKIVIEIRDENYRKRLINGMDPGYRKKILDTITKLQRDGYATADGHPWFCVATPDFTSTCGVCKDGYIDSETIINKTCGIHTSHSKCAIQVWGQRRVDWLAKPCQICEEA
jgi:hypothetical protein